MTQAEQDQYWHNRLVEFRANISQFKVPDGFRVWQHIDMYKQASMELSAYFKGTMTIEQILHPDCILRNVMKLWPIDKEKLK